LNSDTGGGKGGKSSKRGYGLKGNQNPLKRIASPHPRECHERDKNNSYIMTEVTKDKRGILAKEKLL